MSKNIIKCKKQLCSDDDEFVMKVFGASFRTSIAHETHFNNKQKPITHCLNCVVLS